MESSTGTRPGSTDLVDLTHSADFVLALLGDPWSWRQRVVESMDLASSEHVRVNTSYQFEISDVVLEPFLDGARPARVRALIPLTSRAKRPLLNFDVVGPGGSDAHLLLRADNAALQARHLSRLAACSPAAGPALAGLTPTLLEGICAFTPGVARAVAEGEDDHVGALATYLSRGLEVPVRPDDVARWDELQRPARAVLAAALGEAAEPFSSSEQVLLALPQMSHPPGSAEEITAVVDGYAAAVAALQRAGDLRLLAALAECGRRWTVVIAAEIPVGTPTTIVISEDRPLHLRRGNWCEQHLVIAEARSYHLAVRVADPTVRIVGYRARDLTGAALGPRRLEAVRHTPESLSLYSSRADRPRESVVRLRLRPAMGVWLATVVVGVLTVLALIGVIAVPEDERFAAALAVLTVPTTFAVALVVVRDETTLAVRLQRTFRLALCVTASVLWLTALLRLL